MTIKFTSENFDSEVLKSDKTVLVDFYADWCGPCRAVSPLIDQIANETQSVKIGKVNVDEQPEIASMYGVMSIPTLIVFKNGKVDKKVVGAVPKNAILKMIE